MTGAASGSTVRQVVAVTAAPPKPGSPASRLGTRRRRSLVAGTLAVLVLAGGLLAWRVTAGGPPGPPPASLGNAVDLRLPATVLDAPLTDQRGRPTTLDNFKGKVVVLVPFLTSCQEECPVTTGALLAVRRDLAAAGLRSKVVVVEATVDPGRDVPSRLAAYARVTGTPWPLLTGSASTMSGLWRHFGVYTQVVPEGTPAGIDWQTGKPYTYDVDHSDGFILIGADQHERFLTVAPADLRGQRLEPALRRMLDSQGVADLQKPPAGSWTVAQALCAIGWLTGRAVPAGS